MTAHSPQADIKIPSADAALAAQKSYDIALIGAGILGSALAFSLAESGRSVLLLERDLSEPDRIVGELLQPGGVRALERLGIKDTLEGIDAVECEGYQVFWGERSVPIPYPAEDTGLPASEEKQRRAAHKKDDDALAEEEKKARGCSFHHGRFVQNLRRKAASSPRVTLVEATVNSLLPAPSSSSTEGNIVGVVATPKGADSPLEFKATLTIVADGCASKFRREILPAHVAPSVKSHFVGLVLEDADLPAPRHGHVILRQPSSDSPSPSPSANDSEPTLGPVLVYQLSQTPHQTRMLLDVRGPKLPSAPSLPSFLSTHATPILPPSLLPSFQRALARAQSSDPAERKEWRLRSMPNSWLPSYPQGRDVQGVFLAGDALNMRHPLTGGGMTVAFSDAVILTSLLGGGERVGSTEGDKRGKVDLASWYEVSERLEEWHWRRKGVASCVNVLSLALYSLFAAEDESLEVLKTGCFKYFELGGECIDGPVSLLSALRPSPLLLFYHFFRVAFYSIWCMFTCAPSSPSASASASSSSSKQGKPGVAQYPALVVKSFRVFWTACVVLLPVLWSEGQM
ncbi:hypothetical protein JCM6882_004350 [Rhodosporidiobolus microsporus]